MAKPIVPTRDGDKWRVRVRRESEGLHLNSPRFDTEAEAYEWIAAQGETPKSDAGTLAYAELSDLWTAQPIMNTAEDRELKASTQANYRTRAAVLRAVLGPIKLKYLAAKAPGKKRNYTLLEKLLDAQSWDRVNRARYEVVFSRIWAWGYKNGHCLTGSPLTKEKRKSGASKKRDRRWSDEEWDTMLAHSEGQLLMFLKLAMATGCRKGELLGLQWEHVQPVEHKKLGAALFIVDPKNSESRKSFIKKKLYKQLLAYRALFEQQGDTRVFPQKAQTEMTRAFMEARKAAGLDGKDPNGETLTIHAIRRTAATRIGKRGASIAEMRAFGGWKTMSQANRYLEVDEELAAKAALL